mgnify:FL=1
MQRFCSERKKIRLPEAGKHFQGEEINFQLTIYNFQSMKQCCNFTIEELVHCLPTGRQEKFIGN